MNTINQADILEYLQRIVELAQTATVACVNTGHHDYMYEPGRNLQCLDCKGTGRIQDPKLAPLLDVLVKEIPTPKVISTLYGYDCIACGRGCKTIFVKHAPDCGKPILRSWDGLPEGALAGAIKEICYSLKLVLWVEWKSATLVFPDKPAITMRNDSPDKAALQAVLSWLEEYTKEK